MLRGRSFTLLILLAVLAATPAFSTPITWFTDPALWQVAVSGLTTIDFNTVNSVTLNPGDMIESHSTDPGFTFGNVAFTDMINLSVQNTKIGYPSVDSFPFDFGTHAYLQGMGSDGTTFPYLRVKLNSGQTAASASFATGNNGGAGTNITVKLSSGDQYLLPTSSTKWTFLGFVSDTPITEIDIRAVTSNAYPFIDNFTYGSEAPPPPETPDLGTLFLCGAGFTLLSFASRFRKLFHR